MDFHQVGLNILSILLPSLAAVLAAQLVRWLNTFLQKQGLDLTEAQQEHLRQIVRKAILAAEEWARAQGKAGITTTGTVKFALAQSIVKEQLPGVSDTLVDATINAELASARAGCP